MNVGQRELDEWLRCSVCGHVAGVDADWYRGEETLCPTCAAAELQARAHAWFVDQVRSADLWVALRVGAMAGAENEAFST